MNPWRSLSKVYEDPRKGRKGRCRQFRVTEGPASQCQDKAFPRLKETVISDYWSVRYRHSHVISTNKTFLQNTDELDNLVFTREMKVIRSTKTRKVCWENIKHSPCHHFCPKCKRGLTTESVRFILCRNIALSFLSSVMKPHPLSTVMTKPSTESIDFSRVCNLYSEITTVLNDEYAKVTNFVSNFYWWLTFCDTHLLVAGI